VGVQLEDLTEPPRSAGDPQLGGSGGVLSGSDSGVLARLSPSQRQNFSIRVHLDPPGNYYDVSWDIERLKEMVRKKKLKPFWVPVKKPTGEVNWDIAKKMEWDEPILMVDYMPTGEVIVVDGNHRMAKRYMEDPNGMIEAYVVRPRDQILCFCSDLFLYWFMIHHNINVLMSYIIGNTKELWIGDSSDLGYFAAPASRREIYHDPRWRNFLFQIEPLPKVPIRRL